MALAFEFESVEHIADVPTAYRAKSSIFVPYPHQSVASLYNAILGYTGRNEELSYGV